VVVFIIHLVNMTVMHTVFSIINIDW